MGIDELSQLSHLPIDNEPGVPLPGDTPDKETMDRRKPGLTCTTDQKKTNDDRQVVGVENAGGKAYGKATGVYNKHRKYSEQWNPWHPFRLAYHCQHGQSFNQQMLIWIDQHLRGELDNFNIELFQSADAQLEHRSRLHFGLGDDSWIDDHSPIFGTL